MSVTAQWWWAEMPRRVGRRFPGLATIAADGHVFAGLGAPSMVLPLLAFATGLFVGTSHPGFDITFTESLPIIVLVLSVGMASTQLGALLVTGFALGDFLIATSEWSSQVRTSRVSGVLEHPLIANLVLERGPLLIQYALLMALAVAVPLVARSLAGSVAAHLRLPEGIHLAVTTVLVALAAFVVARFWAAAAPVVIRPVFTWSVDSGINNRQPPAGAIEPLQENETWIARWAAIAALVRAALSWWVPRADRRGARVEAVEQRLLEPIEGRRDAPGILGAVWTSLAYAIIGVLLLAGIFEDLWVAAGVAAVFFVARLAKIGTVPIPTDRWRAAVSRIPVLIRFGFAVLVMNGVAKAVFASYLSERNDFQFMAVPVVIGVVLLTVLVPEAVRRTAVLIIAVLGGGVLLALAPARPAAADNCGSFTDCFATADAASTALLGMVFLTALSIAIDFSPLGRVRGGIEAVTGRDLLTGHRLSAAERLLGIVPGGRTARTVRGVGDAASASRVTRAAPPPPRAAPPTPSPPPRPPARPPDHTYRRPSGYRSGVRDQVWNDAIQPSTGRVRDPVTGRFMSRDQPWDMGHRPGHEFRKHQESARERGISREQFLDEYNEPSHYRPELPSSNRSHRGEDLTDDYFGP